MTVCNVCNTSLQCSGELSVEDPKLIATGWICRHYLTDHTHSAFILVETKEEEE